MTRRSDPSVVLVKWCDFTKWLLGHVDNFPQNQRFVFGQRLADGVLAILVLIADATYSDRKSKILLEVNRRLEVLRWLLRLAFGRRLFNAWECLVLLPGTPLFYHHLRHACRLGKIIFGHQQIALRGDAGRCGASYQARSRPRAVGTHAGVPFAG
jgi:hypothetical protein